MNINKKLEIFSRAVDKEVESRRVSILLNIDHKIENAVHEKITEQKLETEKNIEELKRRLSEENRREISKQKSEDKKLLIEKRTDYTNLIFESIVRKLSEYCTTEEYKENLRNLILPYIEKERDIEIHLSHKDMDIAERLKSEYSSLLNEKNIKIIISAADFMGGYKILYKGINIIINNTYLAKIEEERKKFSKFKIQL